MVDRELERLKDGSTGHLFFEGPPLRGKTSLLNVASRHVWKAGALPVRLELSPGLFDQNQHFFNELLAAAKAALCQVARDHDSSSEGSTSADLLADIEGLRFEFDQSEFLTPSRLAGDVAAIVHAAESLGLSGAVFLLDKAEFFDYADFSVLDAIDGLLCKNAGWFTMMAGDSGTTETLREHSYSLAHRFKRIDLGPLRDWEDVRALILGAANETFEGATQMDRGTAYDLWLLSREGEPYWLMVTAHLIWEKSQGREFQLSTEIIKEVLSQQCEAAPESEELREALVMVDRVDGLSDELLQSAGRLAPYQAMTVSECVLAQRSRDLAAGVVLAQGLIEAVEETEGTLAELGEKALIEKEEDRFAVSGDISLKLYLRYMAASRQKERVPSAEGHRSYGTAAAPAWLDRLARELPDVKENFAALLATHLTGGTPDGPVKDLGAPLEKLQTAADKGDAVAMAGAGFRPVQIAALDSDYDLSKDRQLAYAGVVFGVGIDDDFNFESERVSCGWLRQAAPGAQGPEFSASVQAWLEEHETELAEYRLRPLQVVAGVIDRDLTDRAVALMAPFTVQPVVIDLFRECKLRLAVDYLKQVAEAFERGRESEDTPWPYRVAIVDAYVRLGFIAALRGKTDDAWGALNRSLELGREEELGDIYQELLIRYNLAYVRALRGEFAAAAEQAARVLDGVDSLKGGHAFLLLYLPTPATWGVPSDIWNTASVPWGQVESAVSMQARGYDAMAGKYSHNEFLEIVGDLPGATAACARIYGWVLLTRFDDAKGSASAFELASKLADESEGEIVAKELAFAQSAAGQ